MKKPTEVGFEVHLLDLPCFEKRIRPGLGNTMSENNWRGAFETLQLPLVPRAFLVLELVFEFRIG